ncbi:MAG: transposase [Muribaculaceae bacterium]|nr:transposase [Muribaculaceae bacterium]
MSDIADFSSIGSPFFSQYEDIEAWGNPLPHWLQDNKLYFITFRLEDSICKEDQEILIKKKKDFELKNPKPWSPQTYSEYRKIISSKMDALLDKGYGSCILKNQAVRDLFLKSLYFYEDKKYSIMGFVVMPNHVHLLLLGKNQINVIKAIGSVKRFSAYTINQFLNTRGKVWKKGSYDTIVRSEEHRIVCCQYIERNPKYLSKGTYELGGPWIHK